MTVYVKVDDITTTYEEIGDIEPTNYDTDSDYDNDVQYNGVNETVYEKVTDVAPNIVKVADI